MKMVEYLTVRPLPTSKTRGILTAGPITVPCALGRSGLTIRKNEGDGSTPAGRFKLLNVYFRADRIPRPVTALPVEPITPKGGWCDDPHHARYNRPVHLPFKASHETLWRTDHLYDTVVVLDCNMHPAVRGKGSAIFFHIARETYAPTEGCVAVSPAHMRTILSRLAPCAEMRIG